MPGPSSVAEEEADQSDGHASRGSVQSWLQLAAELSALRQAYTRDALEERSLLQGARASVLEGHSTRYECCLPVRGREI